MKISERVAGELRKRIASGDLRDGDELGSEAELITQFNVSRPSLREAVRILESESLLTVTRGARGAKVHKPAVSLPARYMGLVLRSEGVTVADIYRARMMIEPVAVRAVATEAWHSAPVILKEIIEQERQALNDPIEFGRLTVRFHEVLMELGGNKTVKLLMGMLTILFERHAERVLSGVEGPLAFRERGVRAHERLVVLIEECKPEEAEEFWRLHLQHVERTMTQFDGFSQVVDLID